MSTTAKEEAKRRQEKEEDHVLNMASPLLKALYRDYKIDQSQKDRPDKAIVLTNPPKRFGNPQHPIRIGIEITTIDPHGYLSYSNDKKFGADALAAERDNALDNGIVSDVPNKKVDIAIPKTYMYDGLKSKAEKYQNYKNSGDFTELVLLCHSDVLGADNTFFKDGLSEWTNYLLSQDEFPFDKVLFVSGLDWNPVQIYDKKVKLRQQPLPYKYPDGTITVIQSQTLLMGEYDLNKIHSGDPIVKPRSPLVER